MAKIFNKIGSSRNYYLILSILTVLFLKEDSTLVIVDSQKMSCSCNLRGKCQILSIKQHIKIPFIYKHDNKLLLIINYFSTLIFRK